MDSALMVDLICGVVMVIFLLIGALRGPLVEVFSLLGILLGAALVERWAAPWSGDVGKLFNTNAATSVLLTSFGLFILAFLIAGFIAPAALLRFRNSLGGGGRLMGALLGLLNGSLLITYLLAYLAAIDSGSGAAVARSKVGSFLVDKWSGWGLLAVAGGLILFIIVGAFVRSFRILTGDAGQIVQTSTTTTTVVPGQRMANVSPYLYPPQPQPQPNYPRAAAPTAMNPAPPPYQPPYAPPPAPPPYQQAYQPPNYQAPRPPEPPRYASPPAGYSGPSSGRLPGYVPPAPEPPRPAYQPPINPASPPPPPVNPYAMPERFSPPPDLPPIARPPLADAPVVERETYVREVSGPEQATSVDQFVARPAPRETAAIEQPDHTTRYELTSDADTSVMPTPDKPNQTP